MSVFNPSSCSWLAQARHTFGNETWGQVLGILGVIAVVLAAAYLILIAGNRLSVSRTKRREARIPPRMIQATPDAKAYGMIAGIGFTPTEDQAEDLCREMGLRPDLTFSLENFPDVGGNGWNDFAVVGRYEAIGGRRGWALASGGYSVQRRTTGGKRFIAIEPPAR